MAKGATRLARARTHPKQQPDGCRREQARPEDGMVEGRRVEVLLLRLEFPGGRAVLKHLAIPPQADHQAPRDVFHGPKVERKQQHAHDEHVHKVAREPRAKHVDENGKGLEEQVEQGGHWVAQTGGDGLSTAHDTVRERRQRQNV